jgi:redox-sensitive bicupin YhaK (pirin superfamily)
MTNIYHPAPERGHVDFGWLDSYHSFSFGNWHDREKVHFGALRVLNDDIVKGGNGFDNHPQENMEIISIPLKGTLAHKDSTGIEGILSTDDVQIMSLPERSIANSWYNASHFDPVNFLQIWIFPKQLNIKPRHDQKTFDPAGRKDRWQIVVSPRSSDGGLWINQDARLSLTRLSMGASLSYETVFPGNGIYVFVLAGSVELGEHKLAPRDGLGITGLDNFSVRTEMGAELLAIEVPMFA